MKPRKVRVGGHIWTVKWVPGKDMEGLIGLTDAQHLTVFINQEYPPTVQRETLIHELMHVALFGAVPADAHPDEDVEVFICGSSGGLFDAFTRNSWVVEYITKGEG